MNTANLTLVGANNTVLTNAQTRDVLQGVSGTVAKATYDYGLTTGAKNDGLYVNYGLKSLEILSGKTLDLKNSGTGNITANTMNARFTGAGSLDVNGTGTLWLNGAGSNYTGATAVNSGMVIMGGENGFGSTSGVHVKPGAVVDMNGRTLNVGQTLLIDNGGSININGGYLRIALSSTSGNSYIAPNAISGTGTLRVEIPTTGTGSIIFEGDNPNFDALITVANQSTKGSKIVMKTADALGTGLILAGYSSAFVYENVTGTVRTSSTMPASNSGYVVFQSSTVVMTGVTRASTNLVNSDVTFGPTASLAGSGTVTIDNNSTIRMGMGGGSQVTATNPLVFNGGTLDFVAPTRTVTPRLTINDIRGSGTIWVNANPNTGDSNVITFKKTTGNFELNIRMLEIAKTNEQIMPIYSISGTESLATISLANGQVESGAYVFTLVQGTGDNILMPETSMWYLAADNARVSRVATAIVSTAAAVGAEWHYSLDSVSKRMGDLRQEFRGGSTKPKGNFWARAGNQGISAKDSLCGAAFDEDMWVINTGVDKAFRSASAITFVGLFGGAGRVDRTFTNLGDGSSDTLSVGLYVTRLTDAGWYFDLVGKQDMIGNRFNATASDGSHMKGDYDSTVTSASFEVGKLIYTGKNKKKSQGWWLEPSLQAAYASIKGEDYTATGDNYVSSQGISVRIDTATSQQYRAQLRFGFTDKGAKFLPYAKVAGAYNTTSGGKIVADQRELQADFDGLRIEAGLGGSYIINKKNQVYVEYEYANANTYQRKWSLNLGYRHAW